LDRPLPIEPNVTDQRNSKRTAKQCSKSDQSFGRKPNLKQQHVGFMNEYRQLDHMQPSYFNQSRPSFCLPHHTVLKPVVGSVKSSTELSLNNASEGSATVQQKQLETLIPFGEHQSVVTADIKKQCNRVQVKNRYQQLQPTVWLTDPSKQLTSYSLATVNYRTAGAIFLATLALQQLAEGLPLDVINERDWKVFRD
jgi:hypothetical protein